MIEAIEEILGVIRETQENLEDSTKRVQEISIEGQVVIEMKADALLLREKDSHRSLTTNTILTNKKRPNTWDLAAVAERSLSL